MIHVRDVRRAIEGLPDDAMVIASFSLNGSARAAIENFYIDLESARATHPSRPNPGVVMYVRVDLLEEEDEDYDVVADVLEFTNPTPVHVGPPPTFKEMLGEYTAGLYNATALIPGAEPSVLDPRD